MLEVYRDDDLNVYSDAYLFKRLHEKFIQEGKTHTVAVLMKDLWQNHAIFWYLTQASNLVVELHGWEHKDYSKLAYTECYDDLKKSIEYWKENADRMTGKDNRAITTFFAPWNREGDNIKLARRDLGLKFCATQSGEWDGNKIRSFHWWNTMNVGNDFTIEDILD